MTEAAPPRLPPRRAWTVLLPILPQGGGRRLVLVGAASFIGGLLEAAVVVVVATVAEAVAEGRTEVDLGFGVDPMATRTALALAGIALVARVALHVAVAAAISRLIVRSMVDLSRRLFRGFLARRWTAQADEREGHLAHIATSFVDEAAQGIRAATTGLGYALTIAAMLAAAFLVEPVAALATMGTVGVLAASFRPMVRLIHGVARKRAEEHLELSNSVTQAVSLAKEVKVFGVGEPLAGRVDRALDRLSRPTFDTHLLTLLMPPLYQMAALALLLVGLAAVTGSNPTDVASLGAVVLLTLRILSQSQALQLCYQQLCERAAYAELLTDRMSEDDLQRETEGAVELGPVTRLELRDVSYAYVGGVPVLVDFGLEVERGEVVGLTGPSGAGKTTAADILLRLREPDAGAYLVNGQPAEGYALDGWHERFALVPQETVLLRGTVAENIAFLRPDIDPAVVTEAARTANIHDDIVSWPDGYDTNVGERGRSVSGGQRQRIAIARALAGRPDVLVLDEPTSALDFDAEGLLVEALGRLKGTLTVVVVAHRPSTLALCDRVVTLSPHRPVDRRAAPIAAGLPPS